MKPYEEALEQIATAVYVTMLPPGNIGGTAAETQRRRAAESAVAAAKILLDEIDKSEEIRTKKPLKRSNLRGYE